MKELFSKKAKKIITVLSLSCFLCSPVSYIFNMKQVAASSVNSNIVDEQYLDIIGFDKDDNWDRNYSDKRWKHRHHHHRHDDDDDDWDWDSSRHDRDDDDKDFDRGDITAAVLIGGVIGAVIAKNT